MWLARVRKEFLKFYFNSLPFKVKEFPGLVATVLDHTV